MIRSRVSLHSGGEFSSSEVNRNKMMYTENSYVESCLGFGSCPLIWFPLPSKREQENQTYYAKRLSPLDNEENINEEEIVKTILCTSSWR